MIVYPIAITFPPLLNFLLVKAEFVMIYFKVISNVLLQIANADFKFPSYTPELPMGTLIKEHG